MSRPILLTALFICSVVVVPVLAADMPYAGQEARSIKALSDDDIAALRKGEGMGMAKAAELNGYPGPVHVLSLAAQRRQPGTAFGTERSRSALAAGTALRVPEPTFKEAPRIGRAAW